MARRSARRLVPITMDFEWRGAVVEEDRVENEDDVVVIGGRNDRAHLNREMGGGPRGRTANREMGGDRGARRAEMGGGRICGDQRWKKSRSPKTAKRWKRCKRAVVFDNLIGFDKS
ncbi:hypothetical protein Scep_013661 [Stephania cephalantha]|uniref:Uncharacterized protein n=1 Tax=Stephania cephalantha TaxID=152367 RepID=A0AAP0J150_9MAGN